mgnify:CR=1 FL=1
MAFHLKRYLREDLRAYKQRREYSLFAYLYDPMLTAIIIFRLSQWFYSLNIKPLAYLCTRLNDFLHGIWIGPKVKVGPGLFLGHARGLIVNPNTVIGENCVILQRVTLGGPNIVIGDNVFIGAGVQIVSRRKKSCTLRIGNNVKIGASALIINDVPDNAVMTSPVAVMIERKQEYDPNFDSSE